MVVNTDPRPSIFQGVKFHIFPCLPDREELHHILKTNGAQEAESLKVATRVIIDQSHFSQFLKLQCTAMLVTVDSTLIKFTILELTRIGFSHNGCTTP